MKSRCQHSNSQFLNDTPARGYTLGKSASAPVSVLALALMLLIYLLLPGSLAAQEAQSSSSAAAAAQLRQQAGSAASAPQAQLRELRPGRLWLLPTHAEFAPILNRAARQALQHPDCIDVLNGGLNEFRTERTGISFTILCMKDARTTFNQVFYAEDLMVGDELNSGEESAAVLDSELQRLRDMMLPPLTSTPSPTPAQPTGAGESEDGPLDIF
jgi:hypothetical protein